MATALKGPTFRRPPSLHSKRLEGNRQVFQVGDLESWALWHTLPASLGSLFNDIGIGPLMGRMS